MSIGTTGPRHSGFRIDHVGIAVDDLRAATLLFVGTLGGQFLTGGDNDVTGIRLVQVALPGLKVELLQPLGSESVLAPGLRRHGPGFHHMTFMVDDVLKTQSCLENQGFPTTATQTSSGNWQETFIEPEASFGALLQFVSSPLRWDQPTRDFSIDDVLDGRVVWRDYIACVRQPAWPGGEEGG